MIRITITIEAFEAIARTLPFGSVSYETEANERGERTVRLEEVWVNRLSAMRGPTESYSDVILRMGREGRPVLNAVINSLLHLIWLLNSLSALITACATIAIALYTWEASLRRYSSGDDVSVSTAASRSA